MDRVEQTAADTVMALRSSSVTWLLSGARSFPDNMIRFAFVVPIYLDSSFYTARSEDRL
jgi:hypothetical protein